MYFICSKPIFSLIKSLVLFVYMYVLSWCYLCWVFILCRAENDVYMRASPISFATVHFFLCLQNNLSNIILVRVNAFFIAFTIVVWRRMSERLCFLRNSLNHEVLLKLLQASMCDIVFVLVRVFQSGHAHNDRHKRIFAFTKYYIIINNKNKPFKKRKLWDSCIRFARFLSIRVIYLYDGKFNWRNKIPSWQLYCRFVSVRQYTSWLVPEFWENLIDETRTTLVNCG